MPADIIGSELLKDTSGKLEFEYQHAARYSPTSCWRTRSTAPRPRPSRRAARSHAGTHGHRRRPDLVPLPEPFVVSWPRKTPSSRKARTRCRRRSSTASCSRSHLDYPEQVRRGWRSSSATTFGETRRAFQPVRHAGRRSSHAQAARARKVPVSDHVMSYAVDIAAATRRFAAAMRRPPRTRPTSNGARARAPRNTSSSARSPGPARRPDPRRRRADVRRASPPPVLRHRIVTNYRATGAGLKAHDVLRTLLTVRPGSGLRLNPFPPGAMHSFAGGIPAALATVDRAL